MKRLLPLHEMAVNFGLVSNHPVRKRGRKSFFSPEGKVALMFLKMYTQLSAPKLLEQLNGNVHYQIFCDVYVNPLCPLTNYKLIDDIISELSDKLKIQQQQNILADAWKPYMKELVHSTQMRRAMRARCGIRRTRSFCGNALGSHIG